MSSAWLAKTWGAVAQQLSMSLRRLPGIATSLCAPCWRHWNVALHISHVFNLKILRLILMTLAHGWGVTFDFCVDVFFRVKSCFVPVPAKNKVFASFHFRARARSDSKKQSSTIPLFFAGTGSGSFTNLATKHKRQIQKWHDFLFQKGPSYSPNVTPRPKAWVRIMRFIWAKQS